MVLSLYPSVLPILLMRVSLLILKRTEGINTSRYTLSANSC